MSNKEIRPIAFSSTRLCHVCGQLSCGLWQFARKPIETTEANPAPPPAPSFVDTRIKASACTMVMPVPDVSSMTLACLEQRLACVIGYASGPCGKRVAPWQMNLEPKTLVRNKSRIDSMSIRECPFSLVSFNERGLPMFQWRPRPAHVHVGSVDGESWPCRCALHLRGVMFGEFPERSDQNEAIPCWSICKGLWWKAGSPWMCPQRL